MKITPYTIILSVLTTILIGSMMFAYSKNKANKEYRAQFKYKVSIPCARYTDVYYTDFYEIKDGILYFTTDGKKHYHKGEWTVSDNK